MSSLRTDLFRLTQRRLEEDYSRRTNISKHKLEFQDFPKVCRICLSNETLRPISNLFFEGKHLKELIEFAVCTQIKDDDDLPSNICLKCYSDIVKAFAIKELAQKNEALLKSFFNHEPEILYEDEGEQYGLVQDMDYSYEETKEVQEEIPEDINETNEEKLGDGYFLVFDSMDNILHTSLESQDENNPEENESYQEENLEENKNTVILSFNKNKIKIGGRVKFDSRDHTYSRALATQANLQEHNKINIGNDTTSKGVKTFEGAYIEQIKRSMAYEKKEIQVKTEEIVDEDIQEQEQYVYIEENEDNEVVVEDKDQQNIMYTNDTIECEISEENTEAVEIKLQSDVSETKSQTNIWFRCKICRKLFSQISQLKRHIQTHMAEKICYCEICGEGFYEKNSLIRHLKQYHIENVENETRILFKQQKAKEKKFLCQTCGKMFASYTSLQTHTKAVHSQEKNTCEICNKSFSSYGNLKMHHSRHHMEKGRPFKCNICSKTFITQGDLKFHMQTHSGAKNFICQVCGKGFRLKTSYNSHTLIHTGERPHQCKICLRRFVQPTHLNYHSLTHTGERPHACQYCGKTFALKGNLTVHIRTHTGERPYVCDVCGKGFYDSSSMKKHRKGHHGDDSIIPAVLSIVTDENNES